MIEASINTALAALGNFKGQAFVAAGIPIAGLRLLADAGWTGTVIDATHRPIPGWKIIRAVPDADDRYIADDGGMYWPTCSIKTAVGKIGGGADIFIAGSLEILMTAPLGAWTPKVIIVRHNDRWEEISNYLFVERGYRTIDLDHQEIVMRGPM